jgi:uncharacterized protein YhfF
VRTEFVSPHLIIITDFPIYVWQILTLTVLNWHHEKNLAKAFLNMVLQGKKIAMPGVKTLFSIPIQETEQSIFNYVAVLDETADKKDTVLNVLNIVYEQFQVGVFCDHVVVVGDGKSYDLVIK